jgi:regulator of protease activity HflC (stomatin/prohibitin superfamily)
MNIANALKGIASISWLILIAVVIVTVMRSIRKQNVKGLSTLALILLVASILLTTVGAGLVFIQPEERGVVISAIATGGYRPQAIEPGIHWIVPFFEYVERYSISRQTYTMSAQSGEGQVVGDDSIRARTKDGQEVFVDASVIYQIDPAQVIQMHINWQGRFEDGVVRPVTRGIIRDAASQYGVEEIVSTKRAELEDFITNELSAKLAENDMVLVDFVLRDIHFSEEYAAAVEQKQIAEQQALQAQFVVQQRKQEAEQARQVAQGQADAAVIAAKGAAEARILQAQAEAQANGLIAESIRGNPELISYLYVQKLGPGVQTIFVPSSNQFILPLPNTTTPTTPTTTP